MTATVRLRRFLPLVLLALLAAGGIAAWALWPSPRTPQADSAHADDELEWLAAPKTARETAEDVYAADPSGVIFASAHEHTLRRVFLEPGDASIAAAGASIAADDAPIAAAGAPLARMGPHEDVTAMATGDGTLCFASGRGGARERMTVRAGPEIRGPFKTVRADGPPVLAIACDRNDVFVVTADDPASGLLQKSHVERLPLGDPPGAAQTLGHSDGAITSLALDETRVYWADSLDEKIVAVAKNGGSPVVLAEGRGLPKSILAFRDALFWVEQRGESVWTMPKVGGSPRLVVQDFAGFAHLAAGPDGVFWINEAAVSGGFRVLRAPLAGGDATPVAPASPAVDGIDALMVVGTDVLWARDGHVARVSTAVAGTVPSR
jgi:hypothetical protein